MTSSNAAFINVLSPRSVKTLDIVQDPSNYRDVGGKSPTFCESNDTYTNCKMLEFTATFLAYWTFII